MAKLTELDPVVSVAAGTIFYSVDGNDLQSHFVTVEQLTTKVLSGLTGPLSLNGPLTVSSTGLTNGYASTQTGSGSTGGTQHYYNYFNISDDEVNAGDSQASSYSIGHLVNMVFGGTNAHGGRFASFDALTQLESTAASNGWNFYVASGGQGQANVSDGGSIGGGNEKGRLYGGSHNAALAGTATGFEHVAARFDYITMTAGTSAKLKMIHILGYEAQDVEQGTTYDAALGISAEVGAAAGGKYGILIGDFLGADPLSTTATILGTTGSALVDRGIDLSGYSFSSYAFISNGFFVNGSGSLSCLSMNTADIISTIPNTQSGTSGTVAAMNQIINPSNTYTLTLIDPTQAAGRWQYVKTIANFAVNSASANVVPLVGGSAGTAIVTNTAGKWVKMISDGTNWIVVSGN